jgi:UV excision repair protein RAD23
LAASSLKLIHTGKVLKDDDTLDSCGVKEGDFIVVMVAKPKKAAAPAVSKEENPPATNGTNGGVPPESSAADDTAAPAESTTSATAPSPAATTAATTTTTTAATTTAGGPTAAALSAPDTPDERNLFPEEAVTNLISMGFPEAEVRHCLRAAHGNPDIAVEFLTNGIPDNVAAAADIVRASNVASPAAASTTARSGNAAAATSTSTSTTASPLQSLRNHPQFNALRRLVQTNPGALQQVLTQIGQQQPDLLAEINANQSLFLEMMNEPITDNENDTNARAGMMGAASALNMPPGGMPDPMQMAQMIASLPDEQLQQMAAVMGMNPNQLRQMAASSAAGGPGGGNVIRLTPEEMAAVDRLTAMGFDRTEAAQAFLACDKNETLAANLLMDSMANGGGVFGGGDDDDDDGGNQGGGSPDDDDNMYD